MRRIATIGVMAAALIIPAEASASKWGAIRAIKREIRFDYSARFEWESGKCRTRSTNRYVCKFDVMDTHDRACGVQVWRDGAARVRKIGSRYLVDYRIYPYDGPRCDSYY